MKKYLAIVAAALFITLPSCVLRAQDEPTITWKASQSKILSGVYEIVLTGEIEEGLHTYSITNAISPTEITFEQTEGVDFVGGAYELTAPQDFDGDYVHYDQIKIARKVKPASLPATIKGNIWWRCCTDNSCKSPEEYDFSITLNEESAVAAEVEDMPAPVVAAEPVEDIAEEEIVEEAPAEEENEDSSIWGLIIEAILWGFVMLLTPCVFPMVPMTISYFVKGSGSKATGRVRAFMYGLFIVLLYTVPICIIILATRLIGGEAVTSDIFNWIATHWLPNIIFFVIFMVFAASFFGAFEITLPSGMVNKADEKSDKKGLAGVFFMALTLVLVSFSCTGPIVSSVLIRACQGEFWVPVVTILFFSLAFALPFTILALFPSLLKSLPKSGGWLNSVKVVLGFIEIALGFKFLSTADQTYGWHLLDREVYLAIWIATFSLLGFYLLGKLRFKNDDEVKHISVLRLGLAITVFSFVAYMVPGLWGAPLKALSGYLPPIETQDFVMNGIPSSNGVSEARPLDPLEERYDVHFPHGLRGYFSLESGMAAAKEAGKPIFVDITGKGCVNCREMEARVWSDPEVLRILNEDFVLTALFVDVKEALPQTEWVTTDNGKVLKDFGQLNAWIAREKFGVSAQPNYAIIDAEGNLLVPVRGYDLDVKGFVDFLKSGLEAFGE